MLDADWGSADFAPQQVSMIVGYLRNTSMIIAIDETGSFSADSNKLQFFVAIHLRQRKTLYKIKQSQFAEWESSLLGSLKNAKGEIKGSSLSDEQLFSFAKKIICTHPIVRISPLAINPTDNPVNILDKYRAVALIGINEGAKEYNSLGRNTDAKFYQEFGNWLKKLSYAQYLKIFLLGECIATALVNTVGHSISGKYDKELPNIRYLIDKDFIKEPRHNSFWHELLRNQLYYSSRKNPLPLLKKRRKQGHPFLDIYMKNGHMNFNELFWKRLEFVPSHIHFEIRTADAVNTIVTRYFNQHSCIDAYRVIKTVFCKDKRVQKYILEDFDLQSYRYDPAENPWQKSPEEFALET